MIGSSPKYGIGPPPKNNKEFQNDPTMVKRLVFDNLLLDHVELPHVILVSAPVLIGHWIFYCFRFGIGTRA